jgi:hypothetical protein
MWNAEVGDKVRCFGCPRPTASALSSRSRSLTSAFPSPAGEGGDILVTSAPWCHPTPPIRHQSRAVPEMPLDQAICTSRRRHPATSGRYSASPTLIQPARGALSVTYGSRFVPRFCSQTRIRVPDLLLHCSSWHAEAESGTRVRKQRQAPRSSAPAGAGDLGSGSGSNASTPAISGFARSIAVAAPESPASPPQQLPPPLSAPAERDTLFPNSSANREAGRRDRFASACSSCR